MGDAKVKLDEIDEQFAKCRGELLELQHYFGENTAKKTPSELFVTMEQFVAAFTRAEEQLQKQPKKFELLLRQGGESASPKDRARRPRKSTSEAFRNGDVPTCEPSQQCTPTEIAEHHHSPLDGELLEQIFRQCDKDGNGTLDEYELELAEEALRTDVSILKSSDSSRGRRTITLTDFCEFFGQPFHGRADS